MPIVATDLDRTLLPDGDEEYDGTLPVFRKIVQKDKFKLVYITGRSLKQIKEAIYRYDIPWPDHILTNVGSRIYDFDREKRKFRIDKNWFRMIRACTPEWDKKEMKKVLKDIEGLSPQEKSKQDKFKLSYYVDLKKEEEVLKKVKKRLKGFEGIHIIYSVDYPEPRGLLDVMTKKGNKKGALDYVLDKVNASSKEVIYCGDSGNDLSLLTSKYSSVVVANAPENVKEEAREKKPNKSKLHIAKKQKKLNGNYVSGILQGLIHFDMLGKKEVMDLVKKYREKKVKFEQED